MNITSAFKFLLSKIPLLLFIAFCAVILLATIRGIPGNPTLQNMNDPLWKDEGPFELSPERGRFALMFSVLENNSFQFSLPIAQFASPDVAYSNGQFTSLFAPALSFIIMPGYLIGKNYELAQVGTYAIISVFALLNILLVRKIAIKLGAHAVAATLAGLLFVFATPAFAYSVSLYQHHVSTFLILSSLYVLIRWKNLLSLCYVWLACAFSVALDNPNFFFMAPIGIFALTRFIPIEQTKEALKIHFKPLGLLTLTVMIIPAVFFMHINYKSYGNPFQLAGTVSDDTNLSLNQLLGLPADIADQNMQREQEEQQENSQKEEEGPRSPLRFFKTRNLPNGLYTHFLSPDRGMRMYAPVILLGFIGVFLLAKDFPQYHRLLVAIVGVIILVYSMWGDPYGGWAFGSRYMIPAYSILSIGLAIVLTKYRHNILVFLLVAVLGGFSIFVNTIGATTTNRIPPKVQVLSLEEQTGIRQRYTFTRGMEMLNDNRSKSFLFETVGQHYLTAWQYAISIMVAIGSIAGIQLLYLFITGRKKHDQMNIKPSVTRKTVAKPGLKNQLKSELTNTPKKKKKTTTQSASKKTVRKK